MQNTIRLCVSKHKYHVTTAKLVINIKESVVSFYIHYFHYPFFKKEDAGKVSFHQLLESCSKLVVEIQVDHIFRQPSLALNLMRRTEEIPKTTTVCWEVEGDH